MFRVLLSSAKSSFKLYNLNSIRVQIQVTQVVQASRWVSRKPKKVFNKSEIESEKNVNEVIDLSHEFPDNPSNEIELEKSISNKSNVKYDLDEYISEQEDEVEKKPKQKPKFKKSLIKKESDPDINIFGKKVSSEVFDKDGNLIYTKVGTNSSEVCSLMTKMKSKPYRNKENVILLEGKRLIREALLAGCQLKYLIFSQVADVENLKDVLPKKNCILLKMFYRDIQVWSDLVTSPGIIGICKKPNLECKKIPENALPLSLICDSIREPGNLGSILRVGAAVGCNSIYLTKGCIDLWNIKVSRGASGAHFHMRVLNDLSWETLRNQIPDNATVIIADTNDVTNNENDELKNQLEFVTYDKLDIKKDDKIFLVIGGETEGISDEALKLANEFNGVRVHIPLKNNINSLNTATALGIIVYEIQKMINNVNSDVPENVKND